MIIGVATKKDLQILEENQSITQEEIFERLAELNKKIEELPLKTPPSTQEFANRVADLEVKMAKLWALLVEYTPRNQEKLSKMGRRFGGKSKEFI